MTAKATTFLTVILTGLLSMTFVSTPQIAIAQNDSFTMKEVKSYPFPTGLTASTKGSRIAWAFDEEGKRNIYVAEGPDFEARRLTSYMTDDGQAISSLSLSPAGDWVVYIRGGDFGSNWDDAIPVNPTFDPFPPKVQIWSVPFAGGDPVVLGEGENPVISPTGDKIAFVKSGQIWVTAIDGSVEAEKLFQARGNNNQPQWSPDGSKLAFRSNRGDHSFIGVYHNKSTPISWLAPGFDRDHSPRWSPDGTRITFIRQPGQGGQPRTVLEGHHNPWKIMVGEVATEKALQVWKAPETLRGSVPTTQGRTNLNWGDGRIVFLSYHDGWPHLYSIRINEILLCEPFCSRLYILVLRSSATSTVYRAMKFIPIANTKSIVDRKYDVTLACQVLVYRISI